MKGFNFKLSDYVSTNRRLVLTMFSKSIFAIAIVLLTYNYTIAQSNSIPNRYEVFDTIDIQIPMDSSLLEGRVGTVWDTGGAYGVIKVEEINKEFEVDDASKFRIMLHTGTYHIDLMDLAGRDENGEKQFYNVMTLKINLLPQHIKKIFFYEGGTVVH